MLYNAPELLDPVRALCDMHQVKPVFVTLFGSTLYGTQTPGTSDMDVRGLFIPLTPAAPHSLHLSTNSQSTRNLASDVDIDMWSVDYWQKTLLPAGDMGALDLLFAPSHSACTLLREPVLDAVFTHPLKVFNASNIQPCLDYCLRQTKAYGIAGSRIGTLLCVHERAHTLCPQPSANQRLNELLAELLHTCGVSPYCYLAHHHTGDVFFLCGKGYMANLRVQEFFARIDSRVRYEGQRALAARHNLGIDWKAVSHAWRAVKQWEELLLTGSLRFPLRYAQEILHIKQGNVPWREVETQLLVHYARLQCMQRGIDCSPPQRTFVP